ncbi:MAG TPA: lysophospholipid acyltransferase family protein [Gaiellaceae bacterium]|nr:lysophospholipid acyltransferase family protein [Gaiellaceae bacterium]
MAVPPRPAAIFPVPPSGRLARVVRRLGPDRLWRGDPAGGWRLGRVVVTPVVAALAPGSVVYGVERVPREGGVVLAANHYTALDPILVGLFVPRALHFFAKGQLFHRSLLTEALVWAGAIPVGWRADNRAAIRHATELLRAGRVVGIFVEGARQRGGEMGEARPGAALLALRAGVPVVPCGLDTYGWSRRRRRACVAVLGEPIELGDVPVGRAGVELGIRRIADAVDRAREQAVEANAAGRPPALADGARRRTYGQAWRHALAHRGHP